MQASRETSVRRIAVIATDYGPRSHADVIVSRWLEPLPTDHHYGWGDAKTKIASLFIEQRLEGRDLSAEKSRRLGIPIFTSIEEALTLGGDELAVDAVLLIAEHGNYPDNEFQQRLYPRKDFFDRVVAILRKSGRTIPIFFDKHLSWNPTWIREMFLTIKQENIPFFGGSSLPYSPLHPGLALSPLPEIEEIVAVYYDSLEAYLFHSIEYIQAIIEQRVGGETGINEIVAWKDGAVWAALDRGEFSRELLMAAGQTVSEAEGRALEQFVTSRGEPVYAFQLRYRDGLKVTHLMQRDAVRKWFFAMRLKSPEQTVGAYVLTPGEKDFFPHFARLNRMIEDFFLGGSPPTEPERLYFTSMATALSMRALAKEGSPLSTPELALTYEELASGQLPELRLSEK
ncbi:MAG: hypothetical protein WCQ57_00310 [Verrucomicrobiota bacterium]